ncbi:MAG: IPTL-CTERM sorting domain-containing protein [Usitatibacter sp.]
MNPRYQGRSIIPAFLFGLWALAAVETTHAGFILAPDQTSGTGIGSVNTVLTVQNTPSESGCVRRGAGVDIIGPAACLGANTGGNEGTGSSQTQTRSIAELGLTTSDNLRAVLNANESSGGSIQVNSIVLGIFSDSGTLLFTSSLFAPTFLPFTFSGTGTSGFVFRLDPLDTAAAQSFFADPTNRVGLSFSASQSDSGAETLYIADAGGVGAAAVDIAMTKIDSPDPAVVGSNLTYVITARNNGPNTATNVVVTDTLPASVNVVSITPSQGTCSRSGAVITCSMGTIDIGQSATIQVVVVPTATGLISNTVTATATQADTVPANNTAVQTTLIVAAAAVAAAAIPTLSEWGMVILVLAVLAIGGYSRRRRG